MMWQIGRVRYNAKQLLFKNLYRFFKGSCMNAGTFLPRSEGCPREALWKL